MSRNHAIRWVYLIGSPVVRSVKIGVAKDPDARLNELRTGSLVPLQLIWKTRGGRALESELHQYFAPYRTHGEWFDFGGENPAALVASAATLMGYVNQPERVATEDRIRTSHGVPSSPVPALLDHLMKAAAATGRTALTNSEAFAYLATVDPRYERTNGESDAQYGSRVGKVFAKAMAASGIDDVAAVRVPTVDGKRTRGWRLADLQAALSAHLEHAPNATRHATPDSRLT